TNSFTLSFTKGSASNTVIRRSINTAPTTIEEGTAVYNSTGSSFTDSDPTLTKNTTYCYSIWSYNPSNAALSTSHISGCGTLSNMASPTNLTFPTVAYNSIILNWTPGTGSTKTYIVRKQGSIPTNKDDGTVVYNDNGNAFIDTGLTDNTQYCYALYGTDGAEYTEPLTGCQTTSQIINGACGSSNNTNSYSVPTENLCSSGTASNVFGNGPWSWDCIGQGGITSNCSANKKADGTCGTANRSYHSTYTSYRSNTFCSSGESFPSNPDFPTQGNTTNWTCSGENGGIATNCSAFHSISTCISGGGLSCSEITDGLYVINKYTLSGISSSTSTWSIPEGVNNVEVLVVAGGGAGGSTYGGGGGAGGLVYNSSYNVSNNITVTVGGGGATEKNGENSVFGSLTAIGGGASGVGARSNGSNGGSGGGGAGGRAGGVCGNGGTGSQGYNGGAGASLPLIDGGGGGGGAGGVGETVIDVNHSGDGGIGTSNYSDLLIAADAGVDISGVHWIAGGGGGSGYGGGIPVGGIGGGGDATMAGVANTGSGGGGAHTPSVGGAGGSGIVIVRYLVP
ncbi:MAG: fibronectin type III domain-containing protein, partial [Candidatus Pacebacteria bacterium]|nr:fibronectin type III domain-containing protein [Candidatus Paceibacterota bacterium]